MQRASHAFSDLTAIDNAGTVLTAGSIAAKLLSKWKGKKESSPDDWQSVQSPSGPGKSLTVTAVSTAKSALQPSDSFPGETGPPNPAVAAAGPPQPPTSTNTTLAWAPVQAMAKPNADASGEDVNNTNRFFQYLQKGAA